MGASRKQSMTNEGPPLEALTRRLAECPPEFLDEPRLGRKGRIIVPAVVNDLLIELGGNPLSSDNADLFKPKDDKTARNHLRLILIACWLLRDAWFANQQKYANDALLVLAHGLGEAASLTPANKFVADPDRREELARLCLKDLRLRPAGESEAQAQDRLATLNTAERQRVIKAAREAEARAQQIREEMARKAAEEAADKWGRE
jgi:hypothetical protein